MEVSGSSAGELEEVVESGHWDEVMVADKDCDAREEPRWV